MSDLTTCKRCGLRQDRAELTVNRECALPPERRAACRDREIAGLRAKVAELETLSALCRKGYEARGKILAAYRTGGRPSAKALDDAAEVAEKLGILKGDE